MQQLAFRYATEQMRSIWSENRKIITWRQLWIALAEAQMESGLTDSDGKNRIRPDQVAQLRSKIDSFKEDPSEMHRLSALEEECRHDVVAHIRLLGELCPLAKDIIHLGATSCDITDNTDLILIRESLVLLRHRIVGVIDSLAYIAEIHAETPCVAYTHFQPAQLTTIGKRVCLWINDLLGDLRAVEEHIEKLALRGFKGATGTQASYLQLFNGNRYKVLQMERIVAEKMGFKRCYSITGQTYPRKIDSFVMATLSGLGQSAHKFGVDVRLLQHDHELLEPREPSQVGSSAMSHKVNPMRSERLCSLARYLVNECHNAEMTAMTQWLERTLDDSAIRRISLPNSFLAADAVLRLWLNVANGLYINKDVIRKNVWKELPFLMVEPILMRATQAGLDRQTIHEELRRECQKAQDDINRGGINDILRNLKNHPEIAPFVTFDQNEMQPDKYTGCAVEQVRTFLREAINPLRRRYSESVNQSAMLTC